MNSIFFNSLHKSSKLLLTANSNIQNTINKTFSRTMKFIQFNRNNNPDRHCLGVLVENDKSFVQLSDGSEDMIKFIKSNLKLSDIQNKISKLKPENLTNDITILPPVSNPEKIVCIGLNYLDHCLEQNIQKPKEPMFFSKFASALVGPTGNIIAHQISDKIDWEVELAVIIGKEAKNVPKEKAFEYIFGYSVAQDISARDWQKERNGGQFLIGKSMDSFCPLGPSIVHKSVIDDPHNLDITCKVNGILKQNSNTKNLIYRIDDIIYHLTQSITLKPGDVILTGTPGGVGMHRSPPEFLKEGDIVESEIQNLGIIKNKVVKI